MDEKIKDEKKIEKCGSLEIEIPKQICKKGCKICDSKNLEKIHELRKNGTEFKSIVETIKKENNEQISESSLCRHFQNYRANINSLSSEIINKDMIEEATLQSIHLVKLVELIDLSLASIKLRMTNGNYRTDISELEKLMNLRYKLLSSDGGAGDIVALFQQASDKYGYQQSMILNNGGA